MCVERKFSVQCGVAKRGKMGGVCGQNKAWRHCKFSTEKMGQCLGGGLLSLSLSLSLSRCSRFLARLCVQFKKLFTHSNFKANIQIFYSKLKSFDKFKAFHKIISNFKPYARLFHIFTPNFRSVFTDKFNTKDIQWQSFKKRLSSVRF